MLKLNNLIILVMCACSSVIAEDNMQPSPSILGEAEQLKAELTTLKANAFRKIAEDPQYTEATREKAFEHLQEIEIPEAAIQKLAEEPALSDRQKQKAMKALRKFSKKAEKAFQK